ncbi:MAG: hypothetical protein GF409_05165 [Candidatus Omnitrophica bacterium]|nr:hypothetical protein [Candidatus Omnitrophota bacterium]
MAQEIYRTQKTLPGTTGGVRITDRSIADTGGVQLAQSIAGFGRELSGLGIKLDMIEADTQFTKSKTAAREELNRRVMSLKDKDPSEYIDEYQKFLADVGTMMPENPRGAKAYQNWLTSIQPYWQKHFFDLKVAKTNDNYRAAGYVSRQDYIETGNPEYFAHLAKGVKLGAYDAEQAAIFRQNAIDARQRYTEAREVKTKRDEAEQLKLAREETNRKLLTDFWNGKLDNPQVVTDALEDGLITDTDAKYLRNAMMSEDPPELKLPALANVKRAIESIGTNAISRDDALSVLYANMDSLDATTGKSLLNEIFAAQDKNKSEMKREARSLMEELIRDKDQYTGLFTDDERQILASAEAYLMLDEAIEKAATEGKPLERREVLIKAIEIGKQMKKKIDAEEERGEEPSFEPDKPTKAKQMAEFMARLKYYTHYKKGPIRNPQFELKNEEPVKVFDEKGVELGLRMKNGSVFVIGYQAIFNGVKYEYIGNGEWQEVTKK